MSKDTGKGNDWKKPYEAPDSKDKKMPIEATCRYCRERGIVAYHAERNCENKKLGLPSHSKDRGRGQGPSKK